MALPSDADHLLAQTHYQEGRSKQMTPFVAGASRPLAPSWKTRSILPGSVASTRRCLFPGVRRRVRCSRSHAASHQHSSVWNCGRSVASCRNTAQAMRPPCTRLVLHIQKRLATYECERVKQGSLTSVEIQISRPLGGPRPRACPARSRCQWAAAAATTLPECSRRSNERGGRAGGKRQCRR